ncbi:MAG: sarcosine oxidase subunit gamma [Gammaproteobacteria bacterium]|nr:sarcosine oxidase subunit gamma [Gammaproteobacteria bacterium]MYD76454.1 sarcosine oxidase subunit gamma [Gammaproteobacteria bacterium]MYJ52421.1 sarcosine oxidase subunit gamma [Gammaproteobacteria bacterium]
MTEIMTTSPLWDRAEIGGKNTLIERPLCGKINLRSDPEQARFLARAREAFGLDLPLDPNTLARSQDSTCFWLGPDEWLIHCPLDEAASRIESGRSKLARVHHALVDVSDYYTVLRLEGPDSAALLARGCPLDLHRSRFPAGTCAQTRFGNASILLHKTGETPAFDIQVRWSFAEYVWDYLASAMQAL